jgi:hypothetical protein
LGVYFDADAFLVVGDFLEGADVVGGTFFEALVAGDYDGSGQEVALCVDGVVVIFPLGEGGFVDAQEGGECLLA